MLRRTLNALLMVACVALCASCMTSGKAMDPEHVAQLEKGGQSKRAISKWFGEPVRVVKPLQSHPKGCIERWIFVHQRTVAGNTKTQSLLVDFDPTGLVCDHAYMQREE